MIDLYFAPGPNPVKVALFLEETGLPYRVIPVDTRKGEQFKPEFLAINPNAKVPAIVDGDAIVFDSNAILLYLAEKTGLYFPEKTSAARGQMYSWLLFIASGLGPYSGQAAFFRHQAPEQAFALKRYSFEAGRHLGVLDAQLAKHQYLLSGGYTIVDMAAWGWCRVLHRVVGDEGWQRFPNLKRHFEEINSRPAAVRAEAIKDRYTFKVEMDDEARRNLYRHGMKA